MSTECTLATRRVIERFYSAATGGDLKAALALLDEDFEMEQPPYLPYGGCHHGASGLVTVFRGVARWMAPMSSEMEFLIVEGDRAVATARSTVAAIGVNVIANQSWRVLR
jgi:ketosteroid isomerase-like protein